MIVFTRLFKISNKSIKAAFLSRRKVTWKAVRKRRPDVVKENDISCSVYFDQYHRMSL